ncbi:class II D-tagatose-bisphosphate aldolase non-catalytic subunit [Mesoterricola silvestris]|uniref:D-tagatose-bisphosphate aldolase, class II, non-catalytic subunit n=1 Tax=Mesoterricola silvestris TaxID=2927979 RepID=A0AA48KAP7_9BACT|nr:class II D-tagatose-bisphosphate aldolase, non-catalytic subunit [Mesoterricola silvestris]BDU74315.1 D-tagatose-bisphosphate aldolase, class II, non-catalytic subunit [Mesoterricola silvestris]
MPERLLELCESRRLGRIRGLTSICSTHPLVVRAAMDEVLATGGPLLIEASGNQVNQLGGYTGMTPETFRDFVHGLAAEAGLETSRLILGGDHLGPGPWRLQPAAQALGKAGALVQACVAAGYRKLHLDTTVACAGDGTVLSPETAARRAASLCLLAERAWQDDPAGSPPVYVLGLDTAADAEPRVTPAPEVGRSLDLFQAAFAREGVAAAWDRVVALVVQPGVDFSETAVHPYNRKKARPLTKAIAGRRPWMFEAHATDYQHPGVLRELVEDGVGILKVGPWLTFACREALFSLEDVAREMQGEGRGIQLREVLDRAMRKDPVHWKDHHHGPDTSYTRLFSYRDRSRYYWTDPDVEAEVERLLDATAGPLPSQLLDLHLPMALDSVLDGDLEPSGRAIVLHAVRRVLGHYFTACRADA